MRLSLMLLALSLCLPASAQSAKQLNTQGFRLYQAGKYSEALETFKAAVQADPKHALSQYNVAATLGVLRKQGKVCEYDAYQSTILEYLTAAVKLDPKRLERAKKDPDLDPIRDTVGWQQLLGRSPTRAEDVPVIVRQVSWYGPGIGVYGTLVTLRFGDGGKVTLVEKKPQDDGTMKVEKVTGTYTVKGLTVEVKLPGRTTATGSISAEGVLTLESLGTFHDFPSECEA